MAYASFHLGLLEHDFRNPDLIGKVGFSPGQRAHGVLEPGQQSIGTALRFILIKQFHVPGIACRTKLHKQEYEVWIGTKP